MRSESAVSTLSRTLPAFFTPQPPAPRAERLRALTADTFDVLVIGGGATGTGIARDAALRGLKVALVEREDFASGTSSRSTRLIHGGLRYLEHGHLALVFESCIERQRLLRLAPHLVRPLAFSWPVYAGARVPKWKLTAGLFLYDALALFRNVRRFRGLSREQVLESEPGLNPQGLKGGARYYDAATDDARLTLFNALGAVEAGAVLLNHAHVQSLVLEEGRARGATVVDSLTGRSFVVRARCLVNATGPWSDEIRRLDAPAGSLPPAVRGTKGVHIEVPRERIGNRDALTLLSPVDGRVMFILPAGAHTIIGTTETATRAHPSEVRATEADVQYLLDSANAFFPNAHLSRQDVISAWAGIRPLVASGYGHGTANSASREHLLHTSPSGVIAISGGKLTTYRIMARDVVDAVEQALGLPHRRSTTDSLPLPGGDMPSFEETLAQAVSAVKDEVCASHLVRAYGSRWQGVWHLTRENPALAEPLVPGLPYLRAEVPYAARWELVHTLGDLLIRRLKVAFETKDNGLQAAQVAARLMAPVLGWDEADIARQLEAYAQDSQRLLRIDAAEP